MNLIENGTRLVRDTTIHGMTSIASESTRASSPLSVLAQWSLYDLAVLVFLTTAVHDRPSTSPLTLTWMTSHSAGGSPPPSTNEMISLVSSSLNLL